MQLLAHVPLLCRRLARSHIWWEQIESFRAHCARAPLLKGEIGDGKKT